MHVTYVMMRTNKIELCNKYKLNNTKLEIRNTFVFIISQNLMI